MKAKVTLLVDKDTVETAKSIGINLSQFLEHNLKRAINVLEASETASSSNKASRTASSDHNWRRGWDSNPRDLAVTDLAGLRPTRLGDPGVSTHVSSHDREPHIGI
jgi:post-segregation antitoxin (ccd killing protein)